MNSAIVVALAISAILTFGLVIVAFSVREYRLLGRAIEAIESGDMQAAYKLAGRTNYRTIGSVR